MNFPFDLLLHGPFQELKLVYHASKKVFRHKSFHWGKQEMKYLGDS